MAGCRKDAGERWPDIRRYYADPEPVKARRGSGPAITDSDADPMRDRIQAAGQSAA